MEETMRKYGNKNTERDDEEEILENIEKNWNERNTMESDYLNGVVIDCVG